MWIWKATILSKYKCHIRQYLFIYPFRALKRDIGRSHSFIHLQWLWQAASKALAVRFSTTHELQIHEHGEQLLRMFLTFEIIWLLLMCLKKWVQNKRDLPIGHSTQGPGCQKKAGSNEYGAEVSHLVFYKLWKYVLNPDWVGGLDFLIWLAARDVRNETYRIRCVVKKAVSKWLA